MTTFGIGHTDAGNSIWYAVDAINDHPDFAMLFLTDHAKQRDVVAGFEQISDAGFDCCIGAIDGILIWIHRPSEQDCQDANVSSGKFFLFSKAQVWFELSSSLRCLWKIHGYIHSVSRIDI
jgi:hypothetical protein